MEEIVRVAGGVRALVVFREMMKPRTLLLTAVLGGTAILLPGCASPSASPAAQTAGPAAQPTKADPSQSLKKGMTRAEVRQLLGEPADTRPVAAGEGKAEVWVYRTIVDSRVNMVPTSMREIPYVDPITGVMKTIQEPVYSQEQVSLTEELQLLWYDEWLVEWKRVRKGDRAFND